MLLTKSPQCALYMCYIKSYLKKMISKNRTTILKEISHKKNPTVPLDQELDTNLLFWLFFGKNSQNKLRGLYPI